MKFFFVLKISTCQFSKRPMDMVIINFTVEFQVFTLLFFFRKMYIDAHCSHLIFIIYMTSCLVGV